MQNVQPHFESLKFSVVLSKQMLQLKSWGSSELLIRLEVLAPIFALFFVVIVVLDQTELPYLLKEIGPF